MAMAMSSHDRQLEITVQGCDIRPNPFRGCNFLRNLFRGARKPLRVSLRYGGRIYDHKIPSTDRGMDNNFSLPDRSSFPIIQGERTIQFAVWKKINRRRADFVGSGERAGDLRVILHYPNAYAHNFGLRPSSSENQATPAPAPAYVPTWHDHAPPYPPADHPPPPTPPANHPVT